MNIKSETKVTYLRSWLLRFLVFTLIWWIFTDGDMSSWSVGFPVILIVTWISVMLMPPLSWSLFGFLRFIPYFFWRSICAGIDVAIRAIHPRLPISPVLFDYRFRLPPGLYRVYMANTVTMLPGTLSVELEGRVLRVHVLNVNVAIDEELNVLENRIADIFRLNLVDTDCHGSWEE